MALKRQSNVRTETSTLFGRAAISAGIWLDKVGEATGAGRQIDACRHLADLEAPQLESADTADVVAGHTSIRAAGDPPPVAWAPE
jgi:hypothetical protein